jgi:hypothetical protein
MLAKYEPLHLFPVPSTMAASMRKALYPSGSKDDPRDADLLLDVLLQHRDKLHRLSPDNPVRVMEEIRRCTSRGPYTRRDQSPELTKAPCYSEPRAGV